MAHSQLGWQEKMSGGDYQDVGRVQSLALEFDGAESEMAGRI